ncbi:hypothetical protein, partial [Streptomyces europaeiscabiei]|uniref:hypothetical protein n=1 Tax=Streptomyces europaeiscabiei TaxID=146819 RepID=UPI0038F78679
MAPDGQNARGINAARLLRNSGKLNIDDVVAIGYNRYLSAFDYLFPTLFKAYDETKDADIKASLQKPIELLKA